MYRTRDQMWGCTWSIPSPGDGALPHSDGSAQLISMLFSYFFCIVYFVRYLNLISFSKKMNNCKNTNRKRTTVNQYVKIMTRSQYTNTKDNMQMYGKMYKMRDQMWGCTWYTAPQRDGALSPSDGPPYFI